MFFISALGRLSGYFALFEVRSDMLIPKQADARYNFYAEYALSAQLSGQDQRAFHAAYDKPRAKRMRNKYRRRKDTAGTLWQAKGLTLYDAMMLGYNAIGIEQNAKYFEESGVFCTKFMQSERLKHTTRKEKNNR